MKINKLIVPDQSLTSIGRLGKKKARKVPAPHLRVLFVWCLKIPLLCLPPTLELQLMCQAPRQYWLVQMRWKTAALRTLHWVWRCCWYPPGEKDTSSATRVANWSKTPGGREAGCGVPEAACGIGTVWSVLMTEDGPRVSGVGCTAARLDFLWGGSPSAAIATACAEGLRKRLERFGGILSLEKNRKNTTNTAKTKLGQ